jgi:pre-rRNA-processing protein RIX1
MEASSLESSFKPLSPGLQDAASTLLPVLLTNLPTSTLVPSIRAQIDRTAILTKNKAAMIASVLNPQPARKGAKVVSSILPHLARAYGGDQDVEGLLRPRMPVIITGSKMEDLATDYEKDQDSIGQDEAASYSPSNDIQGSPNTSYRPMEIEYHQTQSPADAKQPTAATDAAKPRVYSDVLAASKTAAVAASKGTSPPPKSTKRSHDLDSNEAPQPHEHASKRPKAAVAAAAETLEEDRRILRQLKSSTEYSSSSSSTKPETLPHEVSTNLQSSSGQQQKAAADDEDDEDEDDFDIPKVVLDADTSSDDAEDDES